MRKSRFSEQQIIAILKEQEAGLSTAEVCRRHGVSQPTFYCKRRRQNPSLKRPSRSVAPE